ncbi:hypothetical protein H4582DRAFT_1935948, partial [Lactarius indigo]
MFTSDFISLPIPLAFCSTLLQSYFRTSVLQINGLALEPFFVYAPTLRSSTTASFSHIQRISPLQMDAITDSLSLRVTSL